MERRACRERVDQRTAGHLACVAALHSLRQHTRHCPKIANLGPNVRQVTRCNLTHLAASVVAILGGKGQQARISSSVNPSSRDRRMKVRLRISVGPYTRRPLEVRGGAGSILMRS